MLSEKGIYAITDCANTTEQELLEKSENILKTGISLFQYRNKESDQQKKKRLAQALQSLCHQYNVPFIVNDDVSLAREITADGVHLGKDDGHIHLARETLGTKIIGISCYNDIARAIKAEQDGADYIAFGAFFPSVTKPDAKKAEIELVKQAKSQLSIPVVAIGGITPENAKPLIDANIDYLAVISGLYSASDTIKATQNYNDLFK
jgi:thiamine-phosphate pyrophosphorylase